MGWRSMMAIPIDISVRSGVLSGHYIGKRTYKGA